MMEHNIFGKYLHTISANEQLFLSNNKIICENTKMWEFNRPPDEVRVDEIVEYIKKYNNVEGIIYVAEIKDVNKNFKYVCYDGNHRIEALRKINLDIYVLIQVLWNASKEQIYNKFYNINKAISVPELYIKENNEIDLNNLKMIIQNTVVKICSKYRKYQSTSKRPSKPNFNRDKLVDNLYAFVVDNKLNNIDEDKLFDQIMKLNDDYKKGLHINLKKFNDKILTKCKTFDCHLFLKDFTEDINISNITN